MICSVLGIGCVPKVKKVEWPVDPVPSLPEVTFMKPVRADAYVAFSQKDWETIMDSMFDLVEGHEKCNATVMAINASHR